MRLPSRCIAKASRLSSKRFTGQHVHGGAALRLVGVERHAVAELVQRHGQRRGRRALLLMHGLAESSCLRGGPGDIEQNEHREITPTPQAVQVDGFVGRRPGQHLHPRLDRGVDVDVVTLCLAVAAVQPDPEARQGPPQRVHIGTLERVSMLSRRIDLVHGAPVVPVAPAMHIPLGILPAFALAVAGVIDLRRWR